MRKSLVVASLLSGVACGARTELELPSRLDAAVPSHDGDTNAAAVCHVIIFGGISANGADLHDTWLWDGTNWTELGTPLFPPARSALAMGSSSPGSAVLFGGTTPDATLADAWIWNDNSTYTQIAAPSPGRSDSALASWASGAVLFGGRDAPGAVLGDTWLWDGSNWSSPNPLSSPQARSGHAMARLGDQVVLFGGIDSVGNYLGDTWIWDGETWTAKTTGPMPDPAAFAAMTRWGSTLLLYGGLGSTPGVVWGTTWLWDANTWMQQTGYFADGPSARSHYALITCGEHALMFGGLGADGNALGDTWLWGVDAWTEVHPSTSPPRRYAYGAASL